MAIVFTSIKQEYDNLEIPKLSNSESSLVSVYCGKNDFPDICHSDIMCGYIGTLDM